MKEYNHSTLSSIARYESEQVYDELHCDSELNKLAHELYILATLSENIQRSLNRRYNSTFIESYEFARRHVLQKETAGYDLMTEDGVLFLKELPRLSSVSYRAIKQLLDNFILYFKSVRSSSEASNVYRLCVAGMKTLMRARRALRMHKPMRLLHLQRKIRGLVHYLIVVRRYRESFYQPGGLFECQAKARFHDYPMS